VCLPALYNIPTVKRQDKHTSYTHDSTHNIYDQLNHYSKQTIRVMQLARLKSFINVTEMTDWLSKV